MKLIKKQYSIGILLFCLLFGSSCKIFAPIKNKYDAIQKDLTPVQTKNDNAMPTSFNDSKDTTNSATIKWKEFFEDKDLVALIDTALSNNLDLLMTLQDIEIARNNIKIKHSLILPYTTAGVAVGGEKVGRYTSQGAGDASAEITPGKIVPEILGDYFIGIHSSWEVDIWQKLRNAKKAAFTKYLATIEGRNFVITNLVAEIANNYYELLSLDNKLDIIRETIKLQQNALEIVKVQKEAARVTELAVKKFEAEVLNSQSLEFDILQKIKENENQINFLLGRFPQPIIRDTSGFMTQLPKQIKDGIPSQLLINRPDIKQAQLELFATDCDVRIAKAEFYPSFNISGSAGFQAFKPRFLLRTPESLMLSLIGDLAAPIINRKAIEAEFSNAKAAQISAMYDYQKSILTGYVEVSNELSNINNLGKLYDVKNREVEAHIQAIDISNDLFKSARADYFEVLMTQRDALESRLELIETKKRQYNAVTNLYKALGGGWR